MSTAFVIMESRVECGIILLRTAGIFSQALVLRSPVLLHFVRLRSGRFAAMAANAGSPAHVAAASEALIGQMADMELQEAADRAALADRAPFVPPPPMGKSDKAEDDSVFDLKPAEMEQSFYEELTARKLPGVLIWHMASENIHALDDFPNYCLEKERIMPDLVNACPGVRNERKLLPALGKLWDLAKAQAELGIRRKLEGITEAALEVPLEQEVVDKLNRQHRASYGYQLSAFAMMWPHILGRVKKEIDQKAFSTIPLNRCGSQIEGGKSTAVKQWKSAPGVTTTVGGMAGHKRSIENNHVFVELLQLLMNAYTLLGNFKVPGGAVWCSKAAAVEYFEFVKYRACPINFKWPELAKCLNSEWQSRAAWLPHLQAGKSLTEAIELTKAERQGAWVWATPVVAAAYTSVAGADGSADAPSSADEGPSGWPRASGRKRNRSSRARSSNSGAGSRARVAHPPGAPAAKTGTGKLFCQTFNTGGCANGSKCPQGHLHACNFVDSNGRLCGLTGHRRRDHASHARP